MSDFANKSSVGSTSLTDAAGPAGPGAAVGKRTQVDAANGGAQPMDSPQGDPDAGAPETALDASATCNNDQTQVFESSKQNPSVLATLTKGTSVKITQAAGNYYHVVTPAGATGYVLRSQLDLAQPATPLADGDPAQAAPAVNPFQPIIDKATAGPIDFEGEKAWLLDGAFFNGLLTAMTRRDLGGLPIGDMKGWLNVKAKPAIVKAFQSKPDGPNNTGLFTYQGNYLLWRHAIHHNHKPTGGPENTGTYDAFEGYKLPTDIMARYDAKKKK